jgi:hypothetical protein
MIVKSGDGKFIGEIRSRVFTKKVKGSKHQLLNPPAWCIDKKAFDTYWKQFDAIVIVDTETGQCYKVSTDYFRGYSEELDRGFGAQYMLQLEHWDKFDPTAQVLTG